MREARLRRDKLSYRKRVVRAASIKLNGREFYPYREPSVLVARHGIAVGAGDQSRKDVDVNVPVEVMDRAVGENDVRPRAVEAINLAGRVGAKRVARRHRQGVS